MASLIRVLTGILLTALVISSPASAAPSPAPTTTVGPPIIAPSGGGLSSPSPGSSNFGGLAPSAPVGNTSDAGCSATGLSVGASRNCAGSGSPLSPFPADNFGLDVHVDSDATDLLSGGGNIIAAGVQSVMAWVYGIIVALIALVFQGLGAAFGFDLLASDKSGKIPSAMHGISGVFTEPFLMLAIPVGGCVALYLWLRHHEGKALSHVLAMVGLMIVASVLIADPVGILGGVNRDAQSISGETLSAFSTGKDSGSNAFANAEGGLWNQAVEKSWCALEFGPDTNWCMSPINSETAGWRSDVLTHIGQADSNSTPKIQADEKRRLALARTNGELWLAFPANDNARNGKNDSWTFYHHLLATHPDLAAIRGSGGIAQRGWVLAIVVFGLGSFLLLVGYVTIFVVLAALGFVVLLLLALITVLFPAFGERGRAGFVRWMGALVIACVMKVGYAAYLGILLLVSSVVVAVLVSMHASSVVSWMLWALIFFGGWHYRERMLRAFTFGAHQTGHEAIFGRVSSMAGGYWLGRRYRNRGRGRQIDEGRSGEDWPPYRDLASRQRRPGPRREAPVRVANYREPVVVGGEVLPPPEPKVLPPREPPMLPQNTK